LKLQLPYLQRMNASPFESGIVGPDAIAAYLQQEAQGMKLEPRQGIAQSLDNKQIQAQVTGKVQTLGVVSMFPGCLYSTNSVKQPLLSNF